MSLRRVVVVALSLWTATILLAQDSRAEKEAGKTMDQFMAAFNSRDPRAWAATLNYPHVRLAGNDVRVYNNADDFARAMADYHKRLEPWHHSRWASMKVIQSGAEKATSPWFSCATTPPIVRLDGSLRSTSSL